MKWLYRIFRIFFCPHKWKFVKEYRGSRTYGDGSKYDYFDRIHSCIRCGKEKTFTVWAK